MENNLFINCTKIANNKESFNIVNEQNRKNTKIDKETIYLSNHDFKNIKDIFIIIF